MIVRYVACIEIMHARQFCVRRRHSNFAPGLRLGALVLPPNLITWCALRTMKNFLCTLFMFLFAHTTFIYFLMDKALEYFNVYDSAVNKVGDFISKANPEAGKGFKVVFQKFGGLKPNVRDVLALARGDWTPHWRYRYTGGNDKSIPVKGPSFYRKSSKSSGFSGQRAANYYRNRKR